MAITPTKFQSFTHKLSLASVNMNTGAFKVALCANSPSASVDQVYADLASNGRGELATSNGYTSGGAALTSISSTNSSGTESWNGTGPTWTSNTGNMGPFRYPVLYDSTSGVLVEYIDLGVSVTLNGVNGDQFQVTFAGNVTGTLA